MTSSLATATPAVFYRVEPTDPHTHLFNVTMVVTRPAEDQELALPVWIPGSYLVREFSKNLQQLAAQQNGKPIALQQLDKHRWIAQCAKNKPLTLTYQVAAYDHSVRTAWLDASRGFFNGTSVCLRAVGLEDKPHGIDIAPPTRIKGWQAATSLTPVNVNRAGFGTYIATNYDELVDCPVKLGKFWSAKFTACGVPHRIVVAGAAASFDGERLLADTKRICETEIRFWHGDNGKAVHSHYLFMLNVVDDGYGGLEHKTSTALICGRRDLPRIGEKAAPEGYNTLLGLISHEYFHTWNVKRMRPAEFARYDYNQENYTELLWFFEGFTSYYDDLLLRRAGLIDHATYLRLITKTINQVQQTPGRQVQSVAEASFDAWVKYYRQDENTPNSTVSYYTKGSLVALCLDLALRQHGKTTLDDVMRGLWQRTKGGPMSQDDVLAVLQKLSGKDWSAELQRWVHSTEELPLKELLASHGIELQADTTATAQRLGLRVQESGSGVNVKVVLSGGLAEQAGFMSGDEWLGIELADGEAWRMGKLDDLALYAGASAKRVTAIVSRDRRLLKLPLQLPLQKSGAASNNDAPDTVRLNVGNADLAKHWLREDQPTQPPQRQAKPKV
ncbi:M61 family metallopeptidase [Diaphorobacter sp. HDW4B]|uniref:M61 family metallopeptidase n=1 Tax=Diaphorobacter sp. HDW4B TaxID=2714925 RepID=UPI00140B10DB|nr:M61 family metallopeptidase [Diaphorobacter sp. HDW4B]QIL71583.1 M61 family metallopeptidase [Diaphorobacter sp. HDW4B]